MYNGLKIIHSINDIGKIGQISTEKMKVDDLFKYTQKYIHNGSKT